MDVKIFLRDISREVVDAWNIAFKGYSDVEVSCGDILDLQADAIISPANSFGFMDGGIDLAYSCYFGWDLQKRLQRVIRDEYYGEVPVGNAVIIETKNNGIKYLISAPTMRVPGDISRTINSYLAFRASLVAIKDFNRGGEATIKNVSCPGLGTLTGRMPPITCAVQMRKAYDSVLRGIPPFPNSLIGIADI